VVNAHGVGPAAILGTPPAAELACSGGYPTPPPARPNGIGECPRKRGLTRCAWASPRAAAAAMSAEASREHSPDPGTLGDLPPASISVRSRRETDDA